MAVLTCEPRAASASAAAAGSRREEEAQALVTANWQMQSSSSSSSPLPRRSGRSTFGSLAAVATVSVAALLLRPAEAAQGQAHGNLKAKIVSSAASGVQAEMIPEWRVDAILDPSKTLDALAAAKRAEAEGNGNSSATTPPLQEKGRRHAGHGARAGRSATLADAYVSTAAQDDGKCPMVPLTDDLILQPEYVTIWGQDGKWTSKTQMVSLGSWRQNFFAQAWTRVSIWDADGRVAVKAQDTTEQDLTDRFGWKAGAPAWSYSNISSLIANFEEAMYRTRLSAQYRRPSSAWTTQMAVPSPLWQDVALTDCSGDLLFVVRVNVSTALFPGGVAVYDRYGDLVATSLTNSLTAYHQFIDTQGYVLATAQAPDLNSTIPFADLPKDASRGGLLTYHLKFEQGNYEGASRLLDQDFRWVLAAAVQLRALQDARSVWTPWLPQALPVLYWVAAGLMAFLAAAACLFVYRPFGGAAAPKYIGEGWPGRVGVSWKLPERTL